jgi:hypothetical protein
MQHNLTNRKRESSFWHNGTSACSADRTENRKSGVGRSGRAQGKDNELFGECSAEISQGNYFAYGRHHLSLIESRDARDREN